MHKSFSQGLAQAVKEGKLNGYLFGINESQHAFIQDILFAMARGDKEALSEVLYQHGTMDPEVANQWTDMANEIVKPYGGNRTFDRGIIHTPDRGIL